MKKIIAALFLALLVQQTASADIILGWDATGDTSPATYTAETIITGVNTGGGLNTLTRTGLSAPATANSYSSNGWNLTDTFDQSNDYVSFTVQPATDNTLSLTSLDYAINGSGTAPGTGRWGYSTDGGSNFTLQPTFTITSPAPSLSTWDFTDFDSASTVEFRFWANGALSIGLGVSASTGSIRVPGNISGNDLVLNGTVAAIPEPGSLAMTVIGVAGLLLFNRRRTRA